MSVSRRLRFEILRRDNYTIADIHEEARRLIEDGEV